MFTPSNTVKSMESFSLRLDHLARSQGINHAQAADFIGISYNTWKNWVKGSTEPSVTQLQKINQVFPDWNMNWLLTGHGPEKIYEINEGSFEVKEGGMGMSPSGAIRQKLVAQEEIMKMLREQNATLKELNASKDAQILQLKLQLRDLGAD